MVLHTATARSATVEILELHSIPAPVSRDMADLLPPDAAKAAVAAHAATATAPPPPPAADVELVVRSGVVGEGSGEGLGCRDRGDGEPRGRTASGRPQGGAMAA